MKTYPHGFLTTPESGGGGNTDLLTNVLACWEMDDGSGTTVTSKTGSYNLTTNGNPTWAQSPYRLTLDGADDGAFINTSGLSPASAHSISCWVYKLGDSASTSNHQVMLSRYQSSSTYRVFYLSFIKSTHATVPNYLYWYYYDSNQAASGIEYNPEADIWLNTWNHVVATRSGSVMNLYINGTGVASGTVGNGRMYQTSNAPLVFLGAFNKSTTIPDAELYGHIGQTAVWDRELVQADVDDLYNSGAGLPYASW